MFGVYKSHQAIFYIAESMFSLKPFTNAVFFKTVCSMLMPLQSTLLPVSRL
jgi:hypothetical protein